MKAGTRVFLDDDKLTSIEGNAHEFKKGDSIIVEVITKKSGRCKILAGNSIYKCKAVKGKTNIVKV